MLQGKMYTGKKRSTIKCKMYRQRKVRRATNKANGILIMVKTENMCETNQLIIVAANVVTDIIDTSGKLKE